MAAYFVPEIMKYVLVKFGIGEYAQELPHPILLLIYVNFFVMQEAFFFSSFAFLFLVTTLCFDGDVLIP
jgi:hypothetical protein